MHILTPALLRLYVRDYSLVLARELGETSAQPGLFLTSLPFFPACFRALAEGGPLGIWLGYTIMGL